MTKRQEREAVRRLRELERRAKLQEKLNALEQARLEVERHDSQITLLLSIHEQPVDVWNWVAVLAGLDPYVPLSTSSTELKARLAACAEARTVEPAVIEAGRREDAVRAAHAMTLHAADLQTRQEHRNLAARVLRGDLDAWLEAVTQLRPFEELEELGVMVATEFHSCQLAHCRINVSSPDVIPQEVKTLTSTGKLSVKAMARGRLHEIYQDYVCGCVLRTAHEMFGFLPLETVLVTASVGYVDQMTGQFGVRPVMSVGFERAAFSQLVLGQVDPSDAMEAFPHHGDAKASRKTGSFVPIEPLRSEEFARPSHGPDRFDAALARMRRERDSIGEHASTLAGRLRTAHALPSTEA